MSLEVRALGHRYGSVTALQELSLRIDDGEIVAVLGPSGSGKTTLLEILAGLLPPAAGEVLLDGRTISRAGWALAPERRNIGFVFQDFALWPHMTVAETIAFPLAMRHLPAAERQERVAQVLELVQLEGYGRRYPHELSGGQRQRVAIARALAPHPGMILLDEPMSNLDARLRERMRVQIAQALRHEGVTAVYVTHDRTEALAVADRIAILSAGRLVQAGPPDELYLRPRTAFAATFLGPAALVPAQVVRRAGTGRVEIETSAGVTAAVLAPDACSVGQLGNWLLRPEHVRIAGDDGLRKGEVPLEAVVASSIYLGSHWQLDLQIAGRPEPDLVCHHAERVAPGRGVRISVDPERTWFMP